MRGRAAALSAGSVALAAVVWVLSPYPLDWVGLGDFDPLNRVVLVVLLLSLAEAALARFTER